MNGQDAIAASGNVLRDYFDRSILNLRTWSICPPKNIFQRIIPLLAGGKFIYEIWRQWITFVEQAHLTMG